MNKSDIYNLSAKVCSALESGGIAKLRYPKLYKKVRDYAMEKYPNGVCSPIVKTDKGWSCIVNDRNRNVVLYIDEADGEYQFWEKEI